jgi:hypothetical protein
MHILVHIYASHIYVSYAILNNFFAQLNRISCRTARGYQLVILVICMYIHNKRFIAASSKGNRI